MCPIQFTNNKFIFQTTWAQNISNSIIVLIENETGRKDIEKAQ